MKLTDEQSAVMAQCRSFLDSLPSQPAESTTDERPEAGEFMIGGYAGTGKTTSLRSIVGMIEDWLLDRYGPDAHCYIAAPTNKAAKRLRAKTGKDATTIHRLLGSKPKMWVVDDIPKIEGLIKDTKPDTEEGKVRIVYLKKTIDILHKIKALVETGENANVAEIESLQEAMMEFPLGGDKVTGRDVVVVDEASMVDARLRKSILDRRPSAIVWVGDPGQLKPVSGPRWFQPPTQTTLTKVLRQDGDSGILRLASLVRGGLLNTRVLEKRLADCDDVEFMYYDGKSLDAYRLQEHYGDRWITWRRKDHPFNVTNLNVTYRTVLGRPSPFLVEGDLLYVKSSFSNPCSRVWMHKGDELIVTKAAPMQGANVDWTGIALHRCKATLDGMDERMYPGISKAGWTHCVCEEIAAEDPEHADRLYCCSGGGINAFTGEEYPAIGVFHPPADEGHPWADVASDTEALLLGACTAPDPTAGDPGGKQVYTLLDPRGVLNDEAQRKRIYWMDKPYTDACRGDLSMSRSPIKSVLQANYGYCITVHESQGSEWDAVTVFWDPIHARVDAKEAARWLYTAVTRAAKRVCIVTI